MEKKSLERGLEEISTIFLSSKENKSDSLHQTEKQYEVQETVTIRKELSFYNDENVQENMARSLSEYIEKGYRIQRIDLQKHENISTPEGRTHKTEDVIISIKSSD